MLDEDTVIETASSLPIAQAGSNCPDIGGRGRSDGRENAEGMVRIRIGNHLPDSTIPMLNQWLGKSPSYGPDILRTHGGDACKIIESR